MSFSAFIFSLALLFGALLLSVTTAQALALLLRWIRFPVALLAKSIALFPLGAWIWAAIGLWVGVLGRPIGSLTLTTHDVTSVDALTRMAQEIWWWTPPVFFLALPLTMELLIGALMGKRPWLDLVKRIVLLAIPLQAVVEDAFDLPGVVGGLIPAVHSLIPSRMVGAAFLPALLGGLGWLSISHWLRPVTPYALSAEERILEGAIAIGLSHEEAWKRHLLPGQIRYSLAATLSTLAWAVSLWVSFGCPGRLSMAKAWHQTLGSALNDPWAPLLAAWPYALCALCLWLVSRILLPRHR